MEWRVNYQIAQFFCEKSNFTLLSDQQITPSLRLTPEQISSLCCYPLCAAAGYSSSSSFSFFLFFFLLFSIFILFYLSYISDLRKIFWRLSFWSTKYQATLICYQKPSGTVTESKIFVKKCLSISIIKLNILKFKS